MRGVPDEEKQNQGYVSSSNEEGYALGGENEKGLRGTENGSASGKALVTRGGTARGTISSCVKNGIRGDGAGKQEMIMTNVSGMVKGGAVIRARAPKPKNRGGEMKAETKQSNLRELQQRRRNPSQSEHLFQASGIWNIEKINGGPLWEIQPQRMKRRPWRADSNRRPAIGSSGTKKGWRELVWSGVPVCREEDINRHG